MQIGVYLDKNWVPAFLTVNDQGIIIKLENKAIIIMFKEITRLFLNDQKFIELFYVGMKNGEAIRNEVIINSDNIEEVMKLITERHNDEKSEIYVPPVNNVFNRDNIVDTTISEENIIKQNNMNTQEMAPKKGIPVLIFLPIIIILFIGGTYFLRLSNLNTKETLMELFWSNKQETENYFTYEFLEDNTCRYSHFEEDGKVVRNCKYKLNGNNITIDFIDSESNKYNWKIKYELSISEFKINKVLYLNNEKYTSR